MQIGLHLIGRQPRELLPERHSRALVHEHFAETTDEVEAELCLALALDRPAPEHAQANHIALDTIGRDRDGREESNAHIGARLAGDAARASASACLASYRSCRAYLRTRSGLRHGGRVIHGGATLSTRTAHPALVVLAVVHLAPIVSTRASARLASWLRTPLGWDRAAR